MSRKQPSSTPRGRFLPKLGLELLAALLVLAALYAAAAGVIEGARWVAAALAFVFAAAALVGLRRSDRVTYWVLLLQLLLVPELALLAFIVRPVALPPLSNLLPLGVFIAACEIAFIGIWMVRRRLLKPVISLRTLERIDDLAVAARATQLLVFTAAMVVFEPLFALVMVVLNLCWAAIWILPRWRNVHFETSAEFNVPAERLFEFRRNPDNWKLYRDDIEVVTVQPPGPLSTGTLYVTRQKLPKNRALEIRQSVLSLTPYQAYTIARQDRPAERVSTTFERADGGARQTVRLDGVIRLSAALCGGMLLVPRLVAQRRIEEAKRDARLREILEAVPAE
jgi:hypothetical protein